MSGQEHRHGIRLAYETAETVTLRRVEFEALLAELEEAEDRMAVLEDALAR
jgi:hypothetical protein